MTNEEAREHMDMLIAHKDKALKTHPYFNGAIQIGEYGMTIGELIKQLEDMWLLYGDKVILTVTDEESDYCIKDITGIACAKYFKPEDNVAEVIITISRK